jgi:hypothetical protein
MTALGIALVAGAVLWAVICTLLLRKVVGEWRRQIAPTGCASAAPIDCVPTVTLQKAEGVSAEKTKEEIIEGVQHLIDSIIEHLEANSSDERKVAEIRSLAREGKAIARKDLLWLTAHATAKAKRRATPEEHDFPKYAAVIDRNACQAIPMRFDGLAPLANSAVIGLCNNGGERNITLFDTTVLPGPTEAILVVRPWVRPYLPDVQDSRWDSLRQFTLWLTVDGEELIREDPLEGFLVGPDGYGWRERAFTFEGRPTRSTLLAGLCDEPNGISLPDPKILTDQGIFLARGSCISFGLASAFGEPRIISEIRVRAGLVAARYTTKAP